MLRLSSIARLARTPITGIPRKGIAVRPVTDSVRGSGRFVNPVHFAAGASPYTSKVKTFAGDQCVSAAMAIDQLSRSLAVACTAAGTDRGVISAASLGYDARILVVHSGFERRALINPTVVLVSHQKIHAWDPAGDSVVRVSRHRSIAVCYTTLDGDEETWYAMPLEESEAVQRHLDSFDGFTAEDRAAPPTVGAVETAVPEGCLPSSVADGVVPRDVFEKHHGYFMQLVEPVPRSNVVEAA